MKSTQQTNATSVQTASESAVLTATVFTDTDGIFHSFQYETIEDLLNQIHLFVMDEDYLDDDNIRVTLHDGTKFIWCHTMAHYCFAKGRISVSEMIESLNRQEKPFI